MYVVVCSTALAKEGQPIVSIFAARAVLPHLEFR